MTWVAWRQFRTQALVTLGLLAAFAVLVLVSGLHLRDVFNSLGGTPCSPREACTAPPVTGLDKPLTGLLGPALLAIPALLGMFWGAPLVARELESGTYRLAWTQSVTRRRWLSVRIALVGAAALAVAGLASWLVSWWFAPLDTVNLNRFDPGVFTARGIVAIGYAGFAFALGVATGALIRRTLPAMAATLLGFIAARIAFTFWVRPHLLAAAHTTQPVGAAQNTGVLASPHGVSLFAGSPTIPNAWVYSGEIVNEAGSAASPNHIHALLHTLCPKIGTPQAPPPGASHHANAVPAPGGLFNECMAKLSHHLQMLVTYQPPSHYWPLQALETAIFLAAALLLTAATIWLIGRSTT